MTMTLYRCSTSLSGSRWTRVGGRRLLATSRSLPVKRLIGTSKWVMGSCERAVAGTRSGQRSTGRSSAPRRTLGAAGSARASARLCPTPGYAGVGPCADGAAIAQRDLASAIHDFDFDDALARHPEEPDKAATLCGRTGRFRQSPAHADPRDVLRRSAGRGHRRPARPERLPQEPDNQFEWVNRQYQTAQCRRCRIGVQPSGEHQEDDRCQQIL